MSVYAALSHPAREKIVFVLGSSGPLTYSELMGRVGISETGKFNYHLEKIASFISKERSLYTLNASGFKLYELIKVKNDLLAGKVVEKELAVSRISRIGVVFCTCGGEIEPTIDVDKLTKEALNLEGVVSVNVFPKLCASENVEKLREWCKKNFINFIVIGACSPEIHKEMFNETREVTRVPIEVVNVMEHCAWVQPNYPKEATEKGKLLVEAAVKTVELRKYFPSKTVDVRKSVAIVGGGISGLIAAQYIAKAGYNVYLIERSPVIGGMTARWSQVYGVGDCASCFMAEVTALVALEPNVKILTNVEMTNISGRIGNFEVTLLQKPRFIDSNKCTACGICIKACPQQQSDEYEFGLKKRRTINLPYPTAYPHIPIISEVNIEACKKCRKCEAACKLKAIKLEEKSEEVKISVGAIIFAIGAQVYGGSLLEKFGYDPLNDVISSVEFERMLALDGPTEGRVIRLSDRVPPKEIAIIQCVNDRSCSRFCCAVSRKYMELVHEKMEGCRVHVFYDRKRTPNEIPLFTSRMENVHFVEEFNIVTKDGKKEIVTEKGKYHPDLIVLNVGMVPNTYLEKLHKIVEFALDKDGFLRSESLPPGIFACGSLTGPKDYNSIIHESKAVALEAITLLSKDKLSVEEVKIKIDLNRCGLCGLCRLVCPFKAVTISADMVEVDDFKCKGCGACVPTCPTGAIQFVQTYEEVMAAIEVLSNYSLSPKILAFCCGSCGYAAADNAGVRRIQYPPNAVIMKVPCSGRVNIEFVMQAMKLGFDGILIAGCRENSCKFMDGVKKAKRRLEALKKFYGLEVEKRVRVMAFSAVEGMEFAKTIESFCQELRRS